MKGWRAWCALAAAAGILQFSQARAIDSPQEAETALRRISRDFVDALDPEGKPSDQHLADLLTRLNGLSLYLWDQVAEETAHGLPQTSASRRLHQLLAAAASLQAVLALGLTPTQKGDTGPLAPEKLQQLRTDLAAAGTALMARLETRP